MKPLCQIENADLSHPRRGSVSGLNLRVDPGQVVGVCGAVGSGKSLVARAALGFDLATSGQVLLFGQPIHSLHHDQLMALRQRVAFSSLSASILSNLTISENLEVTLKMRGYSKRAAQKSSQSILHRFGLEPFAARRPDQFPLRVLCLANVVRALVLEADFYVLDEPSRGVEDIFFDLLLGEVQQRAKRGAGFLISVGDPDRWRSVLQECVELRPSGSSDGTL